MLACFDSLTRLLHAEWYKKPLHVHDFALGRRILNLKSKKIVLAEAGIFRGFNGIRNTAKVIRNPTNDWNSEHSFHWQGLDYRTWSPKSTGVESRIQDSLGFPYMGQNRRSSTSAGPLSLLPTKRCQRPPMIHHPPRPLLLLISAVHLGLLLLHPQDMSILSSLSIDGPQSLTALL